MSPTPPETPVTDGGDQTLPVDLPQRSDPELTGFCARVEPQWSHSRVHEVVDFPTVMISVPHARRLVKRSETAATYFGPETTVITTTTFADTELARLSREREVELLIQFEPDYHVPADYSIYQDMTQAEREDQLTQCVRGTRWVATQLTQQADAFTEAPPTVLPLIKGFTDEEREPFVDLAAELDAPLSMFYAAQYFRQGNRRKEFREDVNEIAATLAPDQALGIIGLAHPKYLSWLADCVVFAAGFNAWFDDISPRVDDQPIIKEQIHSQATNVADALGVTPVAPLPNSPPD